MKRIKNWLLPTLMVVATVLEFSFDLIQKAVIDFNLDPNITSYVKFSMFAIGVIILKLQPPSLESAETKWVDKKWEKITPM